MQPFSLMYCGLSSALWTVLTFFFLPPFFFVVGYFCFLSCYRIVSFYSFSLCEHNLARFGDKFWLAKPEIDVSTSEDKIIAWTKWNLFNILEPLHWNEQTKKNRLTNRITKNIYLYWKLWTIECNKSINRIFRAVSIRINYDYLLALLSLFFFIILKRNNSRFFIFFSCSSLFTWQCFDRIFPISSGLQT